MIAVMISSSGVSWTFYCHAGDKVFLVENGEAAEGKREEAMEHLIREARWMFGDLRIVFFTRDDEWKELIHDGAGHLKEIVDYDGPVPEQQEETDDGRDSIA